MTRIRCPANVGLLITTVLTMVVAVLQVNRFLSLSSGLSRHNPFEEPRFEIFLDPARRAGGGQTHLPRWAADEVGRRQSVEHAVHDSISAAEERRSESSPNSTESSPNSSESSPNSTESSPNSKPTVALRGEMRRHEPNDLDGWGRIAHHVNRSGARAEYLRRMLLNGSESEFPGTTADRAYEGEDVTWQSKVTPVPGGYSMALALGTPPQTFLVMVDTGSDLTWVQSRGCTRCFDQPGNGYEPAKSSTYQPLQCSSQSCQDLGQQATCADSESSGQDCDYTYEYGDQSTTNGLLSTETITINTTIRSATVQVPNFPFGVSTDSSVNFGGVDGLLGLGRGPISFVSQLGAGYGQKFAYCLPSYDDVGGASPIIFGDAAVPREAANPYSAASWPDQKEYIQYTPLQSGDNATEGLPPSFWFLKLHSLTVFVEELYAPVRLTMPQGTRTIIDSGTTISMIDPGIYIALRTILAETVRYPQVSARDTGLDLCMDLSGEGNVTERPPSFPAITFNFEFADWVLPRQNTFVPVGNEGIWCLAMIGSPLNGVQIFGNVQQANFQVVYDQPNSRLGFVAADCGSL